MKLGMIVRADKTGLGVMSRRFHRMLEPSKTMVVDLSIHRNTQLYPDWYPNTDMTTSGFPTNQQVREFLKDLDVVISFEIFYNYEFTEIAAQMGVKTILVIDNEYFEWFKAEFKHIKLPDAIIQPSWWQLDSMSKQFGSVYLPAPIFEDEFEDARKENLARTNTRNFLFINGMNAEHDRNGLFSLYDALKYTKTDFTVTIKGQLDIPKIAYPNVRYDFSNPENNNDLFKGYDCLILPRRYAGQSLPMCEALQSAMPVIMTDVDPNNKVLPKEWLVPSYVKGKIMTRFELDLFEANAIDLAEMIDTIDLGTEAKEKAYTLGQQYDPELLKPKFMNIIKKTLSDENK